MNQNNGLDKNPSTNEIFIERVLPKINISSIGELFGTITIVAILILGDLYYWSEQIIERRFETPVIEPKDTAMISAIANDPIVSKLRDQSASDTIESINQDLENTNLNNPI
jgi:hypothetical protein